MGSPVQITGPERELLYRGATARQLSLMSGLAPATVEARMAKVTPNGERNGLPIYRVKDAMPHLVPLPADVVARVIRMNHMDLPPLLKKEYWQGREARARVMQIEKELWRTDAVLDYAGRAFQDIATEIKLMGDAVERDSVLTERQRDAIQVQIDSVLVNIQHRLRSTFEELENEPNGRDAFSGSDGGETEPLDEWEGF